MGGITLFSEVLGREVIVPERPSRIISLSPALTEILYMIGVWDRVVGVSVFDHKPPEAREKPKVGSYYKVNYRLMEELKPDLVLVTTGAQRRVLEELAEKYTVYPIPLPISVSGVIDQVVEVGVVVGELERARELQADLISKAARLRGALKGVRAYYEVFLGGPVTAGGHTYIVDAFRLLGIETPFEAVRTTWITDPPVNVVKEFDPDVIIYEPSPYVEVNVENVLRDFENRGLGELKAVKERRIIIMPPDSLAHYGPSLLDTLENLAEQVRKAIGGSVE
ncbi:MAG: ABC transporter substrate-binding protein [Desulfurococcales archaeon]|nr:ABC transporter substrate-binding protein [Desulfurococcales archaeon]